ncbi:MAG: single-stranded DNA-binding protein [Candidatus Portnoybacteria bacterium CG10_big_fil_rev_8_21_14_0_10_36_7]|uniref:Single-stranded DNA-binding protein n=1 Tax=Candidatus Portnoybacteria bacterium CG10_big_fil_rev_8_21_14_0_10_36_7 TaxID=1974812 RepID=A0A2M8KDG9_9BACT|nr:MAG: single-stranded DNA-binding protein [Candidatus Portnoybacteria bacterium CG10_big_fil_rev_8_21_14_0_10_36_7]
MNFNKAIILGNLTRDPEVRTLPSGQSIATFGIATNRIYNDAQGNRQQAVEFHNIVVFGKLADICQRYLNKGKMVLIEGRIQTRTWQAQDGGKRSRTEIIAENMQMGPKTGNEPTNSPAPKSNADSQKSIPVIDADEANEDGIDIKDIPF